MSIALITNQGTLTIGDPPPTAGRPTCYTCPTPAMPATIAVTITATRDIAGVGLADVDEHRHLCRACTEQALRRYLEPYLQRDQAPHTRDLANPVNDWDDRLWPNEADE